jgi:hypothetical protein
MLKEEGSVFNSYSCFLSKDYLDHFIVLNINGGLTCPEVPI